MTIRFPIANRNPVRLVALLGAAAIAVAACSGSSGSKGTSGSGAAPAVDGVLHVALDLSGNSGIPVTFDPAQGTSAASEVPWQLPIYDSLLHYTTSGALVPGLASAATIVNPTTVSVGLRPGLVFSDGTPLDASAVKASILRNEAAPKHGQFNTVLYDVSSIDVSSSTALTIHLSQPDGGEFYALLAGPETFVVSPAAKDPAAAPIGAGPYVLKAYAPSQQIVLAKNPRYWDAKSIHLSEIDITSVPGGPQQVNAVESGQVNFTQIANLSDVSAIRRDSSLQLLTHASQSSLLWMPVCKTTPPLADVRVRQALSYAINRETINQALLQGTGQAAHALWPETSVLFPKGLASTYAYDPTKARQLLASAGYPNGFSLTLILLPNYPLVSQVAQIIQQEWKTIGVSLTLKSTASYVTDLYIDHSGQTAVNPVINPGLASLDTLRPGNIGDLCAYNNPEIDSIATQLNGLAPTSSAAASLWGQVQTIISQQALLIPLDFQPVVFAASATVRDANLVTSYIVPVPDYHTIYVSG